MSYEVIWEPEALTQAERFAKEDPDGVRQVFTAVDRLADNPRPDGAFGSTDLLPPASAGCRLRPPSAAAGLGAGLGDAVPEGEWMARAERGNRFLYAVGERNVR
ncbi:type II toxin-antitoxin system RelE/ParE family toxin [Streptomyces sp. NPDC090073]|uniref:type II toxin-antitoxin system RelE family toxin n=1 Tax=Streptomyces sp. NPDC090073 TaxID=3365936 RepID=UPI00380D40DC